MSFLAGYFFVPVKRIKISGTRVLRYLFYYIYIEINTLKDA